MNTTQWCSALWAAFCSAPWRVQATVVLALVLLGAGIAAVSLEAGRVAGWASERLGRRREPAPAEPVDPFVRVLALKPSAVRREFQALIDADAAADSEGAR